MAQKSRQICFSVCEKIEFLRMGGDVLLYTGNDFACLSGDGVNLQLCYVQCAWPGPQLGVDMKVAQ